MREQIIITERDHGYSVITGDRPRQVLNTDDVRAGVCPRVQNCLEKKGWSNCIVGSSDECESCITNP